MAEAIGVASGILAFVTVTLHSTKTVCDTLRSVKNAPKDVQEIRTDLEVLRSNLKLLMDSIPNAPLQGLTKPNDELELALTSCADACKRFEKTIEECQKHGKNGKESKRDAAAWVFKAKEIKDFRDTLSSCKETVLIALGAATL